MRIKLLHIAGSVILLMLIPQTIQGSDKSLLGKSFEELQNADESVRLSAAKVLDETIYYSDAEWFRAALPLLIYVLDDPSAEVRFHVSMALAKAGHLSREHGEALRQAIPALVKALEDEDRRVREHCALAIGLVVPNPPNEVTDPLLNLVDDPEKNVRLAALVALARVRPASREMVDTVLRVMRVSESAKVKGVAARTLGEFAFADDRVVLSLSDALFHSDYYVRQEAARALGTLGRDARSALASLEKLADLDDDKVVREVALTAIHRIKADRRYENS